jgi:hypothetical protein
MEFSAMRLREFIAINCLIGWSLLSGDMARGAVSGIGQRVFLHVVCDGGIDPSMVFEWKGGGANSFAVESGSTERTSVSGLRHVSNPSRPAVDAFFDAHGMRVAILNGVAADDMGARALSGPALEISNSGSSRNWLAAYAEDAGRGRPAPVLVFPGVSIEGSVADLALMGRVPSRLLSVPPVPATFPDSVRDRIFRDMRVDFAAQVAGLRAGGGDASRAKSQDKQFRMQQVFEAGVPADWASVFDAAQPAFVNESKLALKMFASGKSLGAIVRAGSTGAWAASSGHFASQSASLQMLYSGLSQILSYAYSTGLQSRLVIVVSGQHGRTPWLNASSGKDPWPVSSMMFWGNGIRSGVTGGMDDVGRGLRIDPRFGTTTGDVIRVTFQNAYSSMLFLAESNWRKWTSSLPVSGLLEI